ncbi:patatin-like phospholipase family protein [Novosphingobium sp. KCTC 2891]|uniref:patatin-like phospholipase family protein n=1 Tax=Novosphingobium sp. KCTC 2891 TaxID=2989730 RepID=UPI002221AD5E|nr:patatin-like phospholipase family protein [Novosphingobium sp. KCTC 2891]
MLVLQGGGALGAYQAGVFEALAQAGHEPDWIGGISIGAINAALIAGNPPERRVERLRAFWEQASSRVPYPSPFAQGWGRRLFNEAAAGWVALTGIPGFFTPRTTPPWLALPGSPEAISVYDTAPLRQTLLDLVDFDLLNNGPVRFSVGAVNVLTGNFVYFDNRDRLIEPDHIMASGALPPGLPPVMIDGEPYWDGGIVSNTPLQYVLDMRDNEDQRHDLLVFQVDLFSARGMMPRSLAEAAQREKDIRFSSRTRLNTDLPKRIEALQAAAARLAEKLPESLRDDPDVALLTRRAHEGGVTVLQLINRCEDYETPSKDYEFSRTSVEGHWQAGHRDVTRSLASPRWHGRPRPRHGIISLDLA